MNRIASITPIWNQELFIGPHFSMLSDLDANFVSFQTGPLAAYHQEHGIGLEPDRSERLIRELFPKVQICPSFSTPQFFGSELFNPFIPFAKDYDLLLKLDADMIFTKSEWDKLLKILRTTDSDCVRINYKDNSLNYYYDLDHGLADALEENEIIAFNPKRPLTPTLAYEADKEIVVNGVFFHHLRGWNKPKSTHRKRLTEMELDGTVEKYGGWRSAPPEVRQIVNNWLKQLNA